MSPGSTMHSIRLAWRAGETLEIGRFRVDRRAEQDGVRFAGIQKGIVVRRRQEDALAAPHLRKILSS
jgi:hypothetical protein